jgi:hypothetical protein
MSKQIAALAATSGDAMAIDVSLDLTPEFEPRREAASA